MKGQTVVVPKGTKGFDVDEVLTDWFARQLFSANYRFALRYIRRQTPSANDLSSHEVDTLLKSGIAVMPVQHVMSESSWTPTPEMGFQYGVTAGRACQECGITPGVTVWLDLEGVNLATQHADVILYCNNWYNQVALAGYQPGLYVGWHDILSSSELYYRLKFKNYWAAYNLNADQYPAVRGVQMKQHLVAGADFDSNLVIGDMRGNLPAAFAPDEWAV